LLQVLSLPGDADEPEPTAADFERLTTCIVRLKRLLNDPVALMDRAKALLEGRALQVLAFPVGLGTLKLLAFIAVSLFAAFDVPILPLDDWARFALAVGWVQCPEAREYGL